MIRILIIIHLILFSINNTYAQKDKQPVDTGISNNSHQLKFVGGTNDFEHLFTKEQVMILDSIIKNFQKQTTIEIAIVTLPSSYIGDMDFDDFITSLGNKWGVGKKDKNNGIIIGISAGLRKIRISNGYGIEAKLSDNETKKIIDNMMIPPFKEKDYYRGARQGLSAIMEIVK